MKIDFEITRQNVTTVIISGASLTEIQSFVAEVNHLLTAFTPSQLASIDQQETKDEKKQSEKMYQFPFPDYHSLLRCMQHLQDKTNLKIEPLPSFVIECLKEIKNVDYEKAHDEKFKREAIGDKLWNQLHDYQKDGVTYTIERDGRVILAFEQGLGKTIVAISILTFYKDWPCLIICPTKVMASWTKELKHFSNIPADNITVIKDSKMLQLEEKIESKTIIYITSYKLAVLCHDILMSKNFKTIIVDECQNVKNRSKQTEKISPLVKNATRAILLSGTPWMLNRDAFQILNMLHPRIFNNFFSFAARYCDPKEKIVFTKNDSGFGSKKIKVTDYSGSARNDELHYILKSKLMLRRTVSEVNSILKIPNFQRIKYDVEIKEKKHQKIIEKCMARIKEEQKCSDSKELLAKLTQEGASGKDFGKDNSFMSAFRKNATIKIEPAMNYVANVVAPELAQDPTLKYLFFAHHKVMLDALELICVQQNIPSLRLDGRTPKTNIAGIVERFQGDNGETRAMIISLTAGGAGLTLTRATKSIFFECHPKTDSMLQAEKRNIRIGQEKECTILYFTVSASIDDILWYLTIRKHKQMGHVLEGVGKPLKYKKQTE